MQINAIIVDDEFHAAENLERLIVKYCHSLTVRAKAYTLQEAAQAIVDIAPQVIFLDIKMPEGNTIDRFDASLFDQSMVVFVTAYDEYAIKAIKVGALDYILKPVHPDELVAAEAKMIQQCQKKAQREEGYGKIVQEAIRISANPHTIGVYVNGEYQLLPFSEITAFEALGAYTKIYTNNNRQIVSSKNIGHYEALIDKDTFCRVHKSYMVNVRHVATVDKAMRTIKMMNNQAFPVSVRLMPSLMSFISK
jgi:two-component system, LytTR family, response regulator